MTALQVPPAPTWTLAQCDGPNSARLVVDLIAAERATKAALRDAEKTARELIAKAEADEKRREREAAAAAWRAYMGYDEDSPHYFGCGCND